VNPRDRNEEQVRKNKRGKVPRYVSSSIVNVIKMVCEGSRNKKLVEIKS